VVVGIEIAASVAAGLVAGDFLDGKFGTRTPYMTITGLVLGTACGMLLLFKTLGRFG